MNLIDRKRAREIVPLVHDLLKPPSTIVRAAVEAGHVAEQERSQWLGSEGGFPAVSIVRYEVIELPLFKPDPHVGQVRIAFGDGAHLESLRAETHGLIERWGALVDRF
ncbi:MAG: hypothetical protein EPO40_01750 [Myxococcaceae bacterium]|nr:MAG: hypothetical protein EPO40_01750 [Myxococcaceae bacterium]